MQTESVNSLVMTICVEQWEYWHVPDVYDMVATCHACVWIGTAGWHVPDVCQRMYHCRTHVILDGMCHVMLEDVSDVPEVKVKVLCTCIVLQAAI